MKPLFIAATEDTPEINFNPKENLFRISQVSLPEDAVSFYKQVLDWLSEYGKNPNPETNFDFEIEYFNTASSKQIIQVILFLEKIAENSNVCVNWHFDTIDEDMQAMGERFRKLVSCRFELVAHE